MMQASDLSADAILGSQYLDLNSQLIAAARGMALQFKLAGQRTCVFRMDEENIRQTLHQEGTQ
jgi:hypothetical protein